MELRHLRYFVTAAEELSISRAAANCVCLSPVSRQIPDLEEEIGTALFDRGNERLQFTAAGEAFLREAMGTLSQAEHATRLTKGDRSRFAVNTTRPAPRFTIIFSANLPAKTDGFVVNY
jgi:DNA-binding transcriptional LysR family regulator